MLFVAVLAAVFSTVSFVVPSERGIAFWIAYAFGLLAVISQLYFFSSAFKRGDSPRSRVYGFPIARIGVIYLIAQLCLSIAEILLGSVAPFWSFLVADAVVLALALIGCVAVEEARGEVTRQDIAVAADTTTIKEFRLTAQMILARCTNEELESSVVRLVDALQFSDPVSSARTAPIEQKMSDDLSLIGRAVDADNVSQALVFIDQALLNIEQRNALCRLSK